MIVKIGNIFESHAQTLVNTVNCVGVMGKGIALDFKNKYPEMFKEYAQLCAQNRVKPGVPYHYTDLLGTSVINFPTKDHWRSPSKLSYIKNGLEWFRDNYQQLGITSIAFPPLGCGNGGLPWNIVGPLMYKMLSDLPIDIEIYAPFGTNPEQISIEYLKQHSTKSTQELTGAKNIPFNKYWLLILHVVQQLNRDQYSLNVGRAIFQKVCYILTRVGIPTGFNFFEGSYGPYANEVKDAIMVLSNANLMTERQFGRMVETVVSPSFKLPDNTFTADELNRANRAVDLLTRIKSTDHAEMVATVLFSYDELSAKLPVVKDIDVFNHVLSWKCRWKDSKEAEICSTINSLSSLGWMNPICSGKISSSDEETY